MFATSAPARAAAAAVLAAVAGLAPAGCGSNEKPTAVTPQAAMRMRSQLMKVRTHAGASDQAGALRALDAFAAIVAGQKSAGRLTTSEDAALRGGVARARARIRVEVSAPVQAPAPSTSAPATAPAHATPQPPPSEAKGKAKGDGEGHGKGHGKGKG